MKIKLKTKAVKADINVFFLNEKLFKKSDAKKVLEAAKFEGKDEQLCFLHESKTLFVGLENFESDNLRYAATKMIQALKKYNYVSANLEHNDSGNIQALIEGIVLGSYEFTMYKSEVKESSFKTLNIINETSCKKFDKIFNEALIIAEATNFTRSLVNTAPQEMNPSDLAKVALKLDKEQKNISTKVVMFDELQEQNMNAICAVGRASIHKPNLIHLHYKQKKLNIP